MLKADGTADCEACGMPMFAFEIEDETVHLECANHHHARAQLPRDPVARRAVHSWIARRGAQLHEQHERWGTDAKEDDDGV